MTGSSIEDLFSRDDFRKLLEYTGITISEEEYSSGSNSSCMRKRTAVKGVLAHRLYEAAAKAGINIDEQTRENFGHLRGR